jgi:AraC-like DNA-binding protein
MQNGAKALLERHPIFRTENVEELGAFLHQHQFRLEIAPQAASEVDVRYNGISLPGIFLGHFQYGMPAGIKAAPSRDDYWLLLPLRGSTQFINGSDSIACDTDRAALASPTRDDYYHVQSQAGSAGIRLVVDKNFLMERLVALLGRPMNGPLEFTQQLDLTSGYGRTLAGYLLSAAADLDHPNSALLSPHTMADFEQFIVNGLLLAQPHNYSNALQRVERTVAPRDVKRAMDFVHSRLSSPITISDIARAAEVPGRTLFKHFKDYQGVSPMRYVRNARLQQVRDALSRAELDSSVTEIASRWGFTHLGRFSVDYRKRFGESPSETLKRRRARRPR